MTPPPDAASRRRDFALMQAARLAAVIGLQMQSVAVAWHVFDLTHDPLGLGWVGLSQFLPAVLLAPLTGQAADRFDRRRVMMTCQALMLACSLALVALGARGVVTPLPIYAVLVVFGAARAFLAPASQSLVTNLVADEDLGPAVAVSSVVFEIGTIAGPMLGGLAYTATSRPTVVYGAAAALGVVALALQSRMRVRTGRSEQRATSLATIVAGARYVAKNRVVLGAISLDLFAVLLGGAVALLPPIARDVLHAGPFGLGVLRAAPAVGAGLVALVLARFPIRGRAGAKMFAGVAVFGVATIVFGLSKNLWLSAAALAVLGAADMVSVVVRLTLVQVATPAEMRGRVSAINMLFVGASNELGEFESGVTASWLGVVPAIVLGGVGTLAVVAVFVRAFPEIRRLDRVEDAAAR